MAMGNSLLRLWTGPIPQSSIRRNLILDYMVHPIKRHLARLYLWLLERKEVVVIGITGSFGKTTTKNLLVSILKQRYFVFATEDNTDSVYNIPNTILHCPWNTKYLILEMSIEYPGEMNFYTWLAKPKIAIITGISLVHTEFLKDTNFIAQEKGLIGKYAHTVLVNAQDPKIQVSTHGEVIKVKPENLVLPDRLIGKQFQVNASLAAATAKLLGCSNTEITTGLKSAKTAKHRMQLIKHSSGVFIIDDVHNANPTATKASIETLVDYAKANNRQPVLCFGQMNELGKYEVSAHQEIGRLIAKNRIKHLFTLGPATQDTIAFAKIGVRCESIEELYKNLRPFLSFKYVILIKGSRSWHLENLVKKLVS